MGFITNNSIFFEDGKIFPHRTKIITIYHKLQLNKLSDGEYIINAKIKKETTLKLQNIDIKIGIGVSNGLFLWEKDIEYFEYKFDGSKYVIKPGR